MSVIVADDSAVIREGVVRILTAGGATIAGQARTADELLALVDDLLPDLAVLTSREREVLALVAEGRSNRSVAERLFVSVKTVEAQVATIFSKLDLEEHPDDNRRVLAVLAYLDGRSRP